MKKNPDKLSLLAIAASLLLLAGAVMIRSRYAGPMYDLDTLPYSSQVLTWDEPDAAAVFRGVSGPILLGFARYYLLPVWLLLLPAIILLAAGLSRLMPRGLIEIGPAGIKKLERPFLAGLMAVSAAASIAVFFLVMGGASIVSDETSYQFQSDILLTGRLYADPPPLPSFFKQSNVLVSDGKWLSKYTIGWPLLLSIGRAVGAGFAVNPILAALSLVLVYLIARDLFSPGAGMISSLLLMLSPFFLFHGASLFPHTAGGFFTLLCFYLIIKMEKENGFLYPMGAGLSIAALFLVRPGDGALLAVGMLPLLAFVLFRRGSWKGALSSILWGGGALALGVGLGLLINKAQTGNPFLFAFTKYNALESLGFSPTDHTPLNGLWNFVYSLIRASFWSAPFLGFLTLASIGQKNPRANLLFIPIVLVLAFYMAYYSLGGVEFGPRFRFNALILVAVLAGGGARQAASWLARRNVSRPAPFYLSAALALAIFTLLSAVFPLLSMAGRNYQGYKALSRTLETMGNPQERSLVFVRSLPGANKPQLAIQTPLNYGRATRLFAYYLMPEENEMLISRFPDRKPYVLDSDGATGVMAMSPYPAGERSWEDYVSAAINYQNSQRDPLKAEQALQKALQMKPDDPVILFNLGFLYFSEKYYSQAAPVFDKIRGSIPDAAYFLARCRGEMGFRDEAGSILQDFTGKNPSSPWLAKARSWLRHYSR
jgi:tetratricopeptide (TPR) repeat protein